MTPTIDMAPAVRPGTYRIDPERSAITFIAGHVGGLFPFHGSFTIRSGELVTPDPTGAAGGSVVIDAASFSTGNGMRDHHVRGWQFLGVSKYPDIVFTFERAEPDGKGAWLATGSLAAHGVTRQVEVQVAAVTAGDDGTVGIRAAASIDRYDFGVGVFPSFVGRRLDFTLDVVAEWGTAYGQVAA